MTPKERIYNEPIPAEGIIIENADADEDTEPTSCPSASEAEKS